MLQLERYLRELLGPEEFVAVRVDTNCAHQNSLQVRNTGQPSGLRGLITHGCQRIDRATRKAIPLTHLAKKKKGGPESKKNSLLGVNIVAFLKIIFKKEQNFANGSKNMEDLKEYYQDKLHIIKK